MVNLELLNQVIDESGLKTAFIAEKSGIPLRTLYRRLDGEGEFTASEIAGLSDVLKFNTTKQKLIFFAQ